MTTTEYLQREIRRAEISLRHAKRKPNTPAEELRGLYEKIEHLREALDAVKEHWQLVHGQRGWTAGEPLTIDQMREILEKSEISGAKVIVSYNGELWCGVLDERADDGICASTGASGEWLKEKDYGDVWLAYAYPAARIDRKKWEPCEYCQRRTSPDEVSMLTEDENGCETGMYVFNGILACNTDGIQMRQIYFCPICGRPLTEAAWAELERRIDSCQ